MSQSASIFTRTVSRHIFLQLCSLWLTTAKLTGKNGLLVTEAALLSSEFSHQVNINTELYLQKFYLLITPNLKALLWIESLEPNQSYQANITFDCRVISNYLTQLVQQDRYNLQAIESLQANLISHLENHDCEINNFIVKAIALLTAEADRDQNNYASSSNTPAMKQLIHHQLGQQYILDHLKTQISQHQNLEEIIQTTLERSCQFLQVDRLVIYQLNVALEANLGKSQFGQSVDIVTYEAKKSPEIPSVLYFKNENCFSKTPKFIHKYRQGFSLAIQDIEQGSNLSPCLQSLMRQLQVRAKAITPINVQGKLWGLAIAHQCFAPRQWQHRELQFMRQMSEYLAIAVQQNQSYQQLQQQKVLLEKQVTIQAQQIKDALIAAEAASQSKHEFLGSMSHELRTPLTCVIGLSGTLLKWSFDRESYPLPIEKQQQYLQLIQESGKHLLNLINNILEFSEVESGKYLLNITQISLADVARKTLQILHLEAKNKSIHLNFEYRIHADEDLFFADAARLTEILLNLVGNGIKFTPAEGQVTLRIWREKHQVIFQVEDTGIGITETEIPLLFEKFKQLEDFRRRTYGGTGVGLALTKQLIELHGGSIEVQSVVGEGSVFTFYLPETNNTQHQLRNQVHSSHQLPTQSPTIVLVTEDEESAVFICQLLTAIDYQVVWLTDATMAIERILLLDPTLVIIDLDCSKTAIQNLATNIKQHHLQFRISIIILCLQLTNEERQFFTAHGVDDYILKSMNPTEVLEKINTSIGNN